MSSRNKIFCGFVAALAVSGSCLAETNQIFTMKDGAFRCGDLEAKMLNNGVVTISSEGKLLAECDAELNWQGIRLPDPEITADEKTQEMTMRFCFDKEGKVFYTRQLKVVGNALELTTTIAASTGKDPGEYLFAQRFEAQVFIPGHPGNWVAGQDVIYDGGRWQAGFDGGAMVPGKTKEKDVVLLNIDALSPAMDLSFWPKDKTLGFSIRNTRDNGMTLYDTGRPDKDGKPQVLYNIVMFSASTNGTWRATQIITPAGRSSEDIHRAQVANQLGLTVPFKERLGYFPVGCSLPIAITIPSSKEMAGDYTVEFCLIDQQDKEVMKKEMPCSVTESVAGNVKYDFIYPQQCALYWMRINVKDKSGGLVLRKEYPFAVTVKLPDLKDIPASSPLGGQPLAGGAMPEGRLVGMKWDRFWTTKVTSWCGIEPERGKFNWEETDRLVEEAVKAGNEILWCLCRTPAWASRLPYERYDKLYDLIKAQYPVSPELKVTCNKGQGSYPRETIPSLFPPKDIKDWERFVREIVRRYKTKVHYWQIWNEPWWDSRRIGKPVDGELLHLVEKDGKIVNFEPWEFCGSTRDYADLVKSASKVIHAEDPTARVVAYGDYWGRTEMEDFYKTGVGDYIDVLSLHYFAQEYCYARKKGIVRPFFFSENYRRDVFSLTEENNIIREFERIHFEHTGGHVPVWNTEEGLQRCSISGRTGSRPLSQEECEKRYGEDARTALTFAPSKMSERRNACWEIQALLFSLGAGMDKVFLHCGHSVSVSPMAEGYKAPTEKGIAWAAMASVLGTRQKVEYCPMNNKDLDAIAVTDISGQKTAVIWANKSEQEVPVSIPVGKDREFKGMDFLGNPVAFKTENGMLNLKVGEEPVYIYDLDLMAAWINTKN